MDFDKCLIQGGDLKGTDTLEGSHAGAEGASPARSTRLDIGTRTFRFGFVARSPRLSTGLGLWRVAPNQIWKVDTLLAVL